MSDNPMLKVPGDYSQYPGKLDHASIVCFRAGRTSRLNKKDSANTNIDLMMKKPNDVIFHPPPPPKPNHVVILPPPPVYQCPNLIDEVKLLINSRDEIADFPVRLIPLTTAVRHSISSKTSSPSSRSDFSATC